MMERGTDIVNATFHNVEYLIKIEYYDTNIRIVAEEKESGDKWIGEFTSSFLENLTVKTGCFKKYEILCEMLSDALHKRSSELYLEILTQTDLLQLKQRFEIVSRKKTKDNFLNSIESNKKKRFCILTLATETDRVHYPLPLSFETTNREAVGALKRTFNQIKNEVSSLRANDRSYRTGVHTIHDDKKHTLPNIMQNSYQYSDDIQNLTYQPPDIDSTLRIQSHLDQIQSGLNQNQENKSDLYEMNYLRSRVHELESRLSDILDSDKYHHHHDEGNIIRTLKRKLKDAHEQLEDDRIAAKNVISRKKKEIADLKSELDKSFRAERQLREQNRNLRSDLERANRLAGRHTRSNSYIPSYSQPRSSSQCSHTRRASPNNYSRSRIYSRSKSPTYSRKSTFKCSPHIERLSRPRSVQSNYRSDEWSKDLRFSCECKHTSRSRSADPYSRSQSKFKRFNPTAYVQQQRIKRTASAERLRSQSPLRRLSNSSASRKSTICTHSSSRPSKAKDENNRKYNSSYTRNDSYISATKKLVGDCKDMDSRLTALQGLIRNANRA